MKLYLTEGMGDTPEGFQRETICQMYNRYDDSDDISEILGIGVLEKVADLRNLMEQLYKVVKSGTKITFQSPYYLAAEAWQSPDAGRGISEQSLAWCSKDWREKANFKEFKTEIDFDVQCGFATEEIWNLKAEDVKLYAFKHYANVIKAIHIVCTKK